MVYLPFDVIREILCSFTKIRIGYNEKIDNSNIFKEYLEKYNKRLYKFLYCSEYNKEIQRTYITIYISMLLNIINEFKIILRCCLISKNFYEFLNKFHIQLKSIYYEFKRCLKNSLYTFCRKNSIDGLKYYDIKEKKNLKDVIYPIFMYNGYLCFSIKRRNYRGNKLGTLKYCKECNNEPSKCKCKCNEIICENNDVINNYDILEFSGLALYNKYEYCWRYDSYIEYEYIKLHFNECHQYKLKENSKIFEDCKNYFKNRNMSNYQQFITPNRCCHKCPFMYNNFIYEFINRLIHDEDEYYELKI